MFDNVLKNANIQEIHDDYLKLLSKQHPDLVVDYLLLVRQQQRNISKNITLLSIIPTVSNILTYIQNTIDAFEIIIKSDNTIKNLKKYIKNEKI